MKYEGSSSVGTTRKWLVFLGSFWGDRAYVVSARPPLPNTHPPLPNK